jgi:peptidoglycan hydrolase-like protein with peptidoglycan-binding domain
MSLKSMRLSRCKRIIAASGSAPPILIGEKGEAVEIVQQALIDLKFPMPISTRATGLADGVFGVETKSVVEAFQKRERLQLDGKVGPKTLGRLDELIVQMEVRGRIDYLARISAQPPHCPISGS